MAAIRPEFRAEQENGGGAKSGTLDSHWTSLASFRSARGASLCGLGFAVILRTRMCVFDQLKQSRTRRGSNECLTFDTERVCDARVAPVRRAQELGAVCHSVHRRWTSTLDCFPLRVERKMQVGQLRSGKPPRTNFHSVPRLKSLFVR